MAFARAADFHGLVFAHGQNVDHFNLLRRYGFKNDRFKAERNNVFNQINGLIILSRKVHGLELRLAELAFQVFPVVSGQVSVMPDLLLPVEPRLEALNMYEAH